MSRLIATYSMLGVSVTLDGLPVIGLADGDDAITVKRRTQRGDWKIGADGNGLFSQTADMSVEIRIKLQPTSPTNTQLENLSARQDAGSLIPFPFDVIDVNNTEGSNSAQCLVMDDPERSYGENATVREWVLASPVWQPIGV